MNKLQTDPPLGGEARPKLFVRAQRVARPPTPWTWAICEEGRAEPIRCATRRYRSAEDAWAVGHAMLDQLPKSAVSAPPGVQRNPAPDSDPASE